MDPEKLLEEVIKEKKKRVNFFIKVVWWAANRCLKCGARLVLYDKAEDPLMVCEWCDQVNQSRILVNSFDGRVSGKTLAPFFNKKFIAFMSILMLTGLIAFVTFRNKQNPAPKNNSNPQIKFKNK